VRERDGDSRLATAALAVHDPKAEAVTWASAGHPPPILLGEPFEPLTGVSAPPLGAGVATGIRQTTVPLRSGSAMCIFTDGLIEARVGDGRLERARLAEMAAGLGKNLTAPALFDRVAAEANKIEDDMALCVVWPAAGTPPSPDARQAGRVEELALPAHELSTSTMERFLEACGVDPDDALTATTAAREVVHSGASGVLVRVETDSDQPVEVTERKPATLSPVK